MRSRQAHTEHDARPMRVLSIIGTRPESIKMAPVVRALEEHSAGIESRVCVTAQHRQMLDQVLDLFDISPDYDLDVMRPGQSPTQVAVAVMAGLEPILRAEEPDWILVQGDTTTVAAAALASFYARTKVAHLEAGLRTFSRDHPFPEEINRRMTAVAADLHFAPTARARQNLLVEDVPAERILVTGNTVIDALHLAAKMPYDVSSGPLSDIRWDRRVILATCHRRENFGRGLHDVCGALFDIARNHPDDVEIVFSVHPNPEVQGAVRSLLGGQPNIRLLEPLEYLPFVHLLARSHLVLTDSGGVQEEAPAFGKPVLVLREVTERPEATEAGTARVIGTNRRRIIETVDRLLGNRREHAAMAQATNPYGDGNASHRVVEALLQARHALPAVVAVAQSPWGTTVRLQPNPLTIEPFRPRGPDVSQVELGGRMAFAS